MVVSVDLLHVVSLVETSVLVLRVRRQLLHVLAVSGNTKELLSTEMGWINVIKMENQIMLKRKNLQNHLVLVEFLLDYIS